MQTTIDTVISRRRMIETSAAVLGAGSLLLNGRVSLAADEKPATAPDPSPPGEPGKDYTPVITPNGITLPWKVVNGIKVFHLVAEEADHEFAPGLRAKCWGYN